MTQQRQRHLTKRQSEITTLVCIGLSNKEVSQRLNLAEGTVKVHLHQIYEKLGVQNRTALAMLAQGKKTKELRTTNCLC